MLNVEHAKGRALQSRTASRRSLLRQGSVAGRRERAKRGVEGRELRHRQGRALPLRVRAGRPEEGHGDDGQHAAALPLIKVLLVPQRAAPARRRGCGQLGACTCTAAASLLLPAGGGAAHLSWRTTTTGLFCSTAAAAAVGWMGT